jgi:hypothetical protein
VDDAGIVAGLVRGYPRLLFEYLDTLTPGREKPSDRESDNPTADDS